ncbi:MAG: Stp1/IreP family PP2C-type Ser/Thr phosphatase [Bacteroidia bacterium]
MLDKIRQLFQSPGSSKRADAYSIQGRKPSQEDAYYISAVTFNGQLFFVADGVGGHAHGEFASNLTVALFRASFESDSTMIADVEAYLREQTMQVAARVYEKGKSDPEYAGCGTTLSGFMVFGSQFQTVNVGDSRVYHYGTDKQLRQLTRDQTVVQDLVDQGKLTPEEARIHPRRNVMNSAIGQPLDQIRIDVGQPQPLQRGEWLLAFSDGVHDALSFDQIAFLIEKHQHQPEFCKALVEAAYEAGGLDNITAVAYRH